jgi:hypothetical protein
MHSSVFRNTQLRYHLQLLAPSHSQYLLAINHYLVHFILLCHQQLTFYLIFIERFDHGFRAIAFISDMKHSLERVFFLKDVQTQLTYPKITALPFLLFYHFLQRNLAFNYPNLKFIYFGNYYPKFQYEKRCYHFIVAGYLVLSLDFNFKLCSYNTRKSKGYQDYSLILLGL